MVGEDGMPFVPDQQTDSQTPGPFRGVEEIGRTGGREENKTTSEDEEGGGGEGGGGGKGKGKKKKDAFLAPLPSPPPVAGSRHQIGCRRGSVGSRRCVRAYTTCMRCPPYQAILPGRGMGPPDVV